jgi:hypothetical protein
MEDIGLRGYMMFRIFRQGPVRREKVIYVPFHTQVQGSLLPCTFFFSFIVYKGLQSVLGLFLEDKRLRD